MKPVERLVLAVVIIVVVVAAGYFVYPTISRTTTPMTTMTTPMTTPMTTAPPQVLTVDLTGNPGTFDPAVSVEIAGDGIYQNIYQPLTYYKNADITQVVPVLAESYSISEDGKTFTFRMRKGISFSNGDPLNAYCVWFSWYRVAIMQQAASFFYVYYLNMTGVTADDLNQLNSPTNTPPDSLIPVITNPLHAITVPDPYTVEFHLGGPFPDLTAWLSRSVIVDPRAVELHGGVRAGEPNSWVALNPIGTGPFMLESFVQGSSAVLVPNPNYWGGPGQGVFPKPKLSKVVIRFVPAEATREFDITSGNVQVAAIDMDRLRSVTDTPGLVLPNIGVSLTWTYLLLNPHLPPMDNILVREAIVHAINGEQINQTVYQGLLYPSPGVLPYPLLGYATDLKQYSYDPNLSKSLLAKAGYPNGKGLPPIMFVYASDYPETFLVAQIVQANLAAVGITVELKGVTFAEQMAADFSQPFDSYQHPGIQWTSATNFPSSAAYAGFNFMSASKGGLGNFNDCSDPTLDSLLQQAGSTYDSALRVRLYQQASHIAYESYCYYWLGNVVGEFPASFFVFSDKVHGYYYCSAFANLDYSTIYLSS